MCTCVSMLAGNCPNVSRYSEMLAGHEVQVINSRGKTKSRVWEHTCLGGNGVQDMLPKNVAPWCIEDEGV